MELVLHRQTLREKQTFSCFHICSVTYSVHKYPSKFKCSLIMTLFCNFFIQSEWKQNSWLHHLKMNLTNKESKRDSLVTEIE